MASNRRLAALMFTDIVGYTALTQADESSALKLLERHNQLLRQTFLRFRCKEIKTEGDKFLVEFDSALEATTCAVELQRLLYEYNLTAAPQGRIVLRIGVHLGDVEERGNDIFGDSVNVASRIEPLAEPGGVCVTEAVFGQVRNKVPNQFEKLERRALKNVQLPLDVYKVIMPWGKTEGSPAVLDKRRVAVMPLVNMISDPAEAYFADGMTEELISAISKVRELDVISRTSVTQFKNTTKKATDIGRELNVGTLMEGSVRKAGNRVRIAVQLIDANSDKHIWAESYDRTLEDVFSIQSEIAKHVAAMLKVALLESEKVRLDKVPTKDPEAHTLYLKGRSAKTWAEAAKLYRQAVEKDPQFALALSALANTILQMGFQEQTPPEESSREGEELVRRALAMDPTLPDAHTVLAVALFARCDYKDVDVELRRALELDPNHIPTLAHMSNWLRFHGRFEESERAARRQLELDPLSLDRIQNLGWQLLLLGHPEESIELLTKALKIDADAFWAKDGLGLAYVQTGHFDKGIALIREAIPMERTFSLENPTTFLAYALGKAGRFSELKDLLAEALDWHAKNHRGALSIAAMYASLRESDKAFEWLEKSFEERPYMLPAAFSDFYFENVRSDPRMDALRRRLELV